MHIGFEAVVELDYDIDMDTGNVTFKQPAEGKCHQFFQDLILMGCYASESLLQEQTLLDFAVWHDCYSDTRVAVMVCVAMEGYHSLVTYQWLKEDDELSSETFPVIYTSDPGTYR